MAPLKLCGCMDLKCPCPPLVSKLLAEFIGMFFVVHVICLSVNGEGTNHPLAIGSAFVVAIYCFGSVSGAHLNPAVSTGLLTIGAISILEWVLYIVAQMAGAIISGLIASQVVPPKGGTGFPSINVEYSEPKYIGLWTEFFFAFMLVSSVLNTACSTSLAYQNNSFFGLTIGFSIFVAAYASGGYSGGAFNPAVLMGVNSGYSVYCGRDEVKHYWDEHTYMAGACFNQPGPTSWIAVMCVTFAAGMVAGLTFLLTEGSKSDDTKQLSEDVQMAGGPSKKGAGDIDM